MLAWLVDWLIDRCLPTPTPYVVLPPPPVPYCLDDTPEERVQKILARAQCGDRTPGPRGVLLPVCETELVDDLERFVCEVRSLFLVRQQGALIQVGRLARRVEMLASALAERAEPT